MWREKIRTVLIGQVGSKAADPAGNLARVAEAIAWQPGNDLAIFPELFLTGGLSGSPAKSVISLAGPEVAELCALARAAKTAIIIGAAVADGSARRNAVICVNSAGELVGHHWKTHLFGDEAEQFEPGDAVTVVNVGGVLVGLMICFEVEFPEIARSLAFERPDLFVAIAANMEPYAEEHRVAVRARALENRTPLVYVNAIGTQGVMRFTGGSCVVDADGCVLADATQRAGWHYVTFPSPTLIPPEVDYLAHRRQAVYRAKALRRG